MPLNPGLYRALSNTFKRGVKIQKDGERMGYDVRENQITGKSQIHVKPAQGGEDYKVCCPFCNDSRFRLEISHRWNTRDEDTGAYFGASFMRCYNDGCDMNPDSSWPARKGCHDRMVEMTKPYIARNRPIVYEQPVREKQPMKLPDKSVPIINLPEGHKAIKYLESRNYDIEYLFNSFRLLYCVDDPNPMVADRIVIPIYMNGELVGWQARYIGHEKLPSSIPKYYTAPGTQRNQLLYNYDNAKGFNIGVLVEGPSDVWRVGNTGVAPLGSAVSRGHIQLISAAWKDGGFVLMMDPDYIRKPRKKPDEPTAYEKLLATLSDPTLFKYGLLEIIPPGDVDPGGFDTMQLLWYFIKDEAKKKGYQWP